MPRKGLLVQFWAFLEEVIAEVNCNTATKVHRGAENGEGGGLPGGKFSTSRGPAVWTITMSQGLGFQGGPS